MKVTEPKSKWNQRKALDMVNQTQVLSAYRDLG